MSVHGRGGSLLAGRNAAPLTDQEIRRASQVFLGLEARVPFKYDAAARTVFRVVVADDGEHYGEVVFGPDLYPGGSVADANSALSLNAAVAHELTHFHRWRDKLALPESELEHLDEALTSLQAIQRYDRDLNPTDVRQLVADAVQRIRLFVHENREEE